MTFICWTAPRKLRATAPVTRRLFIPYGNDGSSIIDRIPEVTAGGVERMVEVGDRIVVESEKVGESARTGTVTGVVGSLIKIKWDDGSETSMVPAAGSLRVVGREAESKS